MDLRRPHQTKEGLIRLWAEKALELCEDIDDEEALAEYLKPVKETLVALNHDRRVLALGGAGSGKSTLLALLANAPVIKQCAMEGHYTCWRYVCRDADASHSLFFPLPSLEGLELVDTADLASEEVRRTCEQLLQGADAVLGVLDARAADASPVWDLLTSIPPEARTSWLLAVAQTDRLDARAAIALKEQLRQLSRMHGVQDVRIFIYPGEATDAATNTLRSCVQELLDRPQGLYASLRVLAERTVDLVQRADRTLSAREGVGRMYSGFMAGIEQEIDNFMHSQMIGLAEYTHGMQSLLVHTLTNMRSELHRTLGWALSPSTLLRMELMGGVADQAIYRHMDAALQHMQEESDKQFSAQCGTHWEHVRPRMKKALECEIGAFPREALETELHTLRERLGRQMYEPLVAAGIRNRLFAIFAEQTGWMQRCIILTCMILIIAGLLGSLGHDAPAAAGVLLAVAVWGIGCAIQHAATRHICNAVEQLVSELCGASEKQFLAVVEGLIVSRMAAYRQLYAAPRHKVTQQESELRPLQERQKTIYTRLRILLQHL